MNRFAKLSPEPMPKLPKGLTDEFEFKTARVLERERKEFKRDRYWAGGRVRYMAHAGGYVMARKRGAMPFVIAEKEWRQLPFVG